ncbi:MAG TPA: hypothetical protein DHW02_23560 [Ktedonobacter sp.]|nr:hypothetical protein [Ktedonobacter sp.]
MVETLNILFRRRNQNANTTENAYEIQVRESWSGRTIRGTFVPPYEERQLQALRKKLSKLHSNQEQELRTIGHRLFLSLCGLPSEETANVHPHEVAEQSVQAVLRGVIQRTLHRRGTIALTLSFEPDCHEFVQYPWELLHSGNHFLLASGIFTLSRALIQPDAEGGGELSVRPPFRVLYIGASPCDCAPLETEKSYAALERGLSPLIDTGHILLDKLEQATFDELVSYLNSYGGTNALNDGETTEPCYIVHFDGHGVYGRLCTHNECSTMNEPDAHKCSECDASLNRIKPQTYLCFCQDDGSNRFIDTQTLCNLFTTSDVRLAVFSACETAAITSQHEHRQRRTAVDATLATALVMSQVAAVVAMPFAVRDDLSPTFMFHFYNALADGRTLEEGLARARQALLPTQQSWFIPVLYRRVTEGHEDPVPLLTTADEEEKHRSSTHPLSHMSSPSTFIGREQELRELDALLTTAARLEGDFSEQPHVRLRPGTHHIVITGAVGIGKSALACEAVQRNHKKFQGGVVGISLQGGKSFGDALLEMLNALHTPLTSGPVSNLQHRAHLVLETLRTMASRELPCLLFLDSFEEIKDHTELDMWLHFLSQIPEEIVVLVTSHSNPETMAVIDGPHCRWYEFHIGKMTNEDLLTLFRELASSNGLDQYIHLENPDQQKVLQEICTLLDGYPLGAELIFGAARTINGRIYTPEAATRSLEEIRDELHDTPLAGILAVLEVSFRRLSPYARLLMAYLAAFVLPFSKEQIVMLVQSQPFTSSGEVIRLGREEALENSSLDDQSIEVAPAALMMHWSEARDELVQASFIQFDGRVYNIHPQIRHFALAHLPREERQRIHRVVAAYYYNLPQPGFEEWMAAINHLESAGEAQDLQEVVRVAVRASWASGGRGHAHELLVMLQRVALHATRLNDKTGEGELQCCLGAILRQQGKYSEAEACLRTSLDFHREQQEREHAAWALYELAMLFREMGSFQQASTYAQEGLALFGEANVAKGEAWMHLVLGEISRGTGAYYEASGRFERALSSFRTTNNKEGCASALRDRGTVYEALGQYTKAHRDYEEALRLFQELGLRVSQAWVLADMGIVYADQGKMDIAEKCCAEAAKIFREQGVRRGEGWALWAMGDVMRERRDLDKAKVFYEEANAIFIELDDRIDQARVLNALGAVALLEEEFLTAQDCYEQAQAIAQEQDARQIYGRALRGLGDVARVMQRFADAEQYYKQSLALANELDTPAERCAVLRRQGLLFQAQEQFSDALDCWIHALALDMRLGHPARTYLQQSVETLVREHSLQEARDTYKKQYGL